MATSSPPHDWRLGRYPEGEYDIEEPEERPIKLTITKHERTPNITFDTVAPVCIRRVDMPEDGGKLKSKEFIGRAASVAEAIANLQESFPYGNLDPIQYNMDCIVVAVSDSPVELELAEEFYAIYLEKPE